MRPPLLQRAEDDAVDEVEVLEQSRDQVVWLPWGALENCDAWLSRSQLEDHYQEWCHGFPPAPHLCPLGRPILASEPCREQFRLALAVSRILLVMTPDVAILLAFHAPRGCAIMENAGIF